MEFLGLNVNVYLILLAVILYVADFFIAAEIATWVSFIIVAIVVTKEIPLGISDMITNILVRVLIAIVVLAGLILLHYKVFRKVSANVIDKYVAPDKRKDGVSGSVGRIGVIREIEGRMFIKIDDEVLPFTSEDDFKDKDTGRVVGSSDGVLIITKTLTEGR